MIVGSLVSAATLWLPPGGGAQHAGWQANPEVARKASEQQPGFNYDESGVAPYTLPDPLGLPHAPMKKVRTAEE